MTISAKPFLKWAGGKGQLLPKFQELYPPQLKEHKIKTFYEPFLGSGAVFFDVVQKYNVESAMLYDINPELIITYKSIQNNVFNLIEILHRLEKNYLKLDNEKRKVFFYAQRAEYNSTRFDIDTHTEPDKWLNRAAALIFLNRTCFNGLYRVNSKGEFNSPAGEYKNPKICDEPNLLAVSNLLQKAEIIHSDFDKIDTDIKPDAFVYFDPPYRAISKTSAFKAYSKNGFKDADQARLAHTFKKLDKKNVLLMLSNSDPKNHNPDDLFFDELYNGYNILRVPAKRMINSNASKRGSINEIVVTNYDV